VLAWKPVQLSPCYLSLPKAAREASARPKEVVSSSQGLFVAASRTPPPKTPYQKPEWALNLQLPEPCLHSGEVHYHPQTADQHRSPGWPYLPHVEAGSRTDQPMPVPEYRKATTCYSSRSSQSKRLYPQLAKGYSLSPLILVRSKISNNLLDHISS
jgi:hypothetical protein